MTTAPKDLSERVATSYTKLANAAKNLNTVSDELGKYVAFIDSALKKLNLGISVWEKIRGGGGDQYDPEGFWKEELGYAKIGGKWGIALRKVEGTYRDPDQAAEEQWLYSDAPRYLRLSAIEKLPELLEKLSNEALDSANEIQAKLADVEAIAAVLNPESFPKPPKQVSGTYKKGTFIAARSSPVPQPQGIQKAFIEMDQTAVDLARAIADDERLRAPISKAFIEMEEQNKKNLEQVKDAMRVVGDTILANTSQAVKK